MGSSHYVPATRPTRERIDLQHLSQKTRKPKTPAHFLAALMNWPRQSKRGDTSFVYRTPQDIQWKTRSAIVERSARIASLRGTPGKSALNGGAVTGCSKSQSAVTQLQPSGDIDDGEGVGGVAPSTVAPRLALRQTDVANFAD